MASTHGETRKTACIAYAGVALIYLATIYLPVTIFQDIANETCSADLSQGIGELRNFVAGWIALFGILLGVVSAAILAAGVNRIRIVFLVATIMLLVSELLVSGPVCRSSFQSFIDSSLAILSGSILVLVFSRSSRCETR